MIEGEATFTILEDSRVSAKRACPSNRGQHSELQSTPMSKLRYTGTLLKEFVHFARAHKAYWIVPLLIVLGLMALLIATGQASAPFIYTLF